MDLLYNCSLGHHFLCQHVSSKKYFTLKVLNKTEAIKTKSTGNIFSELEILSNFNDPSFPSFVGTSQNSNNFYILTNYTPGGEFHFVLQKLFNLSEQEFVFYSANIISIMKKLHSKNIICRDLRPEHFLMKRNGFLMMFNMDFVKQVKSKLERTFSLVGGIEFKAPEVLKGTGYSVASDLWGLGILIFEIISGNHPFSDLNPMKMSLKIFKNKPYFPSFISKEAKDLVL